MKKVHFIVDQVRYNTDDIPLLSRAETLARKLNYSKKDILYLDTTSSWDEIKQLKSGELNCLIIDEAQLFTPGQQDLLVDIIKELVRTKNIDVIITIDNGRIKENKNYIYNAFNT